MRKLLLIGLIATIIVCVGCSMHETKHDWNEFSYTVSQGETLWEIAEEYCPEDMDCREYIYEVKELNNMKTSDLAVGQTITLLTTEKEI